MGKLGVWWKNYLRNCFTNDFFYMSAVGSGRLTIVSGNVARLPLAIAIKSEFKSVGKHGACSFKMNKTSVLCFVIRVSVLPVLHPM